MVIPGTLLHLNTKTISIYTDTPLKVKGHDGPIQYRLSGTWQVRECNEQGFFYGRLIFETKDIIEMLSWLNQREVSC